MLAHVQCMRSARHDPFKSTVARPAQMHRARTLQPTCALSPRGRRHARQRTSPGAVRVARHRWPERPGRRVLDDTDTGGIVSEGQRVFLGTGKTPGISFLVEIFGEIPPRPGQVGNTWEMHYGTNTGSCGVHLVLLRPSQHSGARPGVVPRGEKRTKFSCGKRPRPGCAEWIHVFFMLYDGTEGLLP